MGQIIAFFGGLFLIFLVGKLLLLPIKIVTKLLFNGIIGGVALYIFNIVGGIFGLEISITSLNAIIVGILGVPGVLLILIYQRLF